ncbi:MAG: PAS domain S-box protein, partial [Chamaesiphon sp.]|nr:PAS domain S-box protein [Chamaesiphon sp.]
CPTVTGVAKCWEVSVIPLRHADGHVEQILAISHDVTERRQVEDELRQAQALAQRQLVEIEAIYQTAPIGLTTIDVDFRFQRVNQRLAEMNGVTIEDHIGRTVREVIGDLADGNELLLRRVLETGEPLLNLELSGETNAQPGIYRTWIANYYPLKDPTGQSIGVNIVVQEITDRKRAEAALIESEEQFRSTFDQAAVGIAHVSLDGRWLVMNSKLCEIVGYMEAELLDLTFQNITHPEDLSINLEYAHQLIAGERQTYTMEKRYIHKLGHIVWVNLTVSIRLDPAGTPLHFISVIEAIDDRKRLELDLQAQTVELTKTTALIELRNQELHRFSHTVSHDLKAPLRGFSNLATWISEDLPPTVDPDIFANLDLMRARIARMNSLIDGLLEYARVGSTSTSLATFSVEQLLAEIVDSLSIPDSFVVELPADLPPITTHPVLLSQVLANLIGNAYKHHDSPGETLRERTDGRIQVTAQPDAKLWTFRVTDNGRGIAPENQAEVFDIFKTLSDTDQNSTGIGLSIVKKLVETHGGEITLESQLGVGTTFNFTWMPEQTR